ncbi:MAG: tetratricopeptide repeat protein [Pseudomonadota bacterium]
MNGLTGQQPPASSFSAAGASRRGLAAALLALGLLSAPAAADPLAEFVRLCSAPESSAEDALRFCERALDEGGRRLDARNRALLNFNAGVAALALSRNAHAVERLSEAIRLQPRMTAAYVSRAQAHEAGGRIEAALADYESAIAADPNDPGAHLGRGALLADQGAYEAAVVDLGRAIALQPDWAASFFERGRAHYALGDYTSAERDFSAVIARSPRDATAWINRGEARLAGGMARAGNDFDRAVLLAPEWGGAYYARGRFHERSGATDAANADFLRAYQLGHNAPDLVARVKALSGG